MFSFCLVVCLLVNKCILRKLWMNVHEMSVRCRTRDKEQSIRIDSYGDLHSGPYPGILFLRCLSVNSPELFFGHHICFCH